MKIRRKPLEFEGFPMPKSENLLVDAPHWILAAMAEKRLMYVKSVIVVFTREGPLNTQPGSWIVRNLKGDIWPVAADDFADSYEVVVS